MISKNHLWTLLSILAIGALIAISYSNTIHSPFQFDDYPNIADNKSIKINSLHINSLVEAAANSPSRYRWIPNITFAVQYYFSALNTPAYHIFNITIHFFCAVVLYFLILSTLDYAGTTPEKNRKIELALVATILWSLHPVQTNAVTYIVQRMTSLSALFYLSAIFLYAKGRRPNQPIIRRYLLFLACLSSGLLAFTSKENAAILPLTIIAYEIFFISRGRFFSNRRQAAFTLGGAFLLLLVLGWLWLGRDIFQQILQGYHGRYFSLSERLMTEPRVIFYYLSILIFPAPHRLNISYDTLISTSLITPPTTILAICGLLLLIYSIHYLFNKDRILSFAILWFLLNLVIESSIIPLELCYEHRLYLPSTFLVLPFVLLIYRYGQRHIALIRAGMGVLILCLGLLTWNRNIVWQSKVSLWSDTLVKSPNLIRAYANLANALSAENNLPLAEKYLIKALEIDANREIDHNHPAWKYDLSLVHNNFAEVYRKQKNFPRSRYHTEKALQLSPNSIAGLLTKGILLVEEGNYMAAEHIFTEIAAGGVESVDLYNNWGICAYNTGDTDRAIALFSKALTLDPNHVESHYNLGIAYGTKGMMEEARREMSWGMQM